VLDRCLTWDQPAKACVSGLTYIPTIEGFLYLTVVLDLFDRKPIGWSISEGMKASAMVKS
jgi:transposase InsO family protein